MAARFAAFAEADAGFKAPAPSFHRGAKKGDEVLVATEETEPTIVQEFIEECACRGVRILLIRHISKSRKTIQVGGRPWTRTSRESEEE